MKIAVYAISKNEEQFVERCIKSAAEADCFILCDTGSKDATKQIARDCGAQVFDISISPWRFDTARNASLALVPADIDVCICIDLDEVLNAGWRAAVEQAWQQDTTRLLYKYDWSNNIVFYADKIHKRHGYSWQHPCHELLTADARTIEQCATTDFLAISHYPDETKSRALYLPLLELGVKESPHCVRNYFYYARELVFTDQHDKAITALQHYLTMPDAVLAHERAYAMRLIAESFERLGQMQQALYWHRQGCNEAPHLRDGWVHLAQFCLNQKQYAESHMAIQYALNIAERAFVYTADPKCWTAYPYDIGSIAAWNLGLKELALANLNQALLYDADNPRLVTNLAHMMQQDS